MAKIRVGRTYQWRDSGGDEVITLASLAATSGRQGALKDMATDLGVARHGKYRWRFFCQFATNPVVGETVEIYAKTGDGTVRDNDDGAGDAALSATDKLRNLTLLGVLVVDEAVASKPMSIGGVVEISEDEFAPVIYNASADALHATAANNGFDLTPILE